MVPRGHLWTAGRGHLEEVRGHQGARLPALEDKGPRKDGCVGLLRGNRAQDETVQAERGCRPPGVLRQAAAAGDTLRPLLGGLQTLLDHGSRLGEGARGCRDQRPAPREGRVGAGPPRVRSSCGGGTRTGATCPRGQGVRPGKAGLGLCEVEADFSLKVGFVWVTGGGTREGLLPSVPGRGDPGSVTQPPTARSGAVCGALWKAPTAAQGEGDVGASPPAQPHQRRAGSVLCCKRS